MYNFSRLIKLNFAKNLASLQRIFAEVSFERNYACRVKYTELTLPSCMLSGVLRYSYIIVFNRRYRAHMEIRRITASLGRYAAESYASRESGDSVYDLREHQEESQRGSRRCSTTGVDFFRYLRDRENYRHFAHVSSAARADKIESE